MIFGGKIDAAVQVQEYHYYLGPAQSTKEAVAGVVNQYFQDLHESEALFRQENPSNATLPDFQTEILGELNAPHEDALGLTLCPCHLTACRGFWREDITCTKS
jgi:hypothetical protein